MKIKRKTFLGGVITTLCACTALTFGMLSGDTTNAHAEEISLKPSINITDSYFVNVANTNYNPSISYDTHIAGGVPVEDTVSNTLSAALTTENTVIAVSNSSSTAVKDCHLVFIQFTVGYSVPARTTYEFTYNFDMAMSRTNTTNTAMSYIELFEFGETGTTQCGSPDGMVFDFRNGTSSSYRKKAETSSTTTCSTSYSTATITYSNTSDKQKSMSTSFALRFSVGSAATNNYNFQSATCKISGSKVKSTEIPSLTAPTNVSMDYNGTAYSDANLDTMSAIAGASWYNSSKMTLSLKEGTAKDAGEYNIEVALKGDDCWKLADGTFSSDPQTIKLSINKATPTVSFGNAENTPLYTTKGTQDEFPEPTITYNGAKVEGTFSWGEQKPEGKAEGLSKDYNWTFTPTDTKNFNSKSDTVKLTFISPLIEKVTATFNAGGSTVYKSTPVATLNGYFTVKVKYTGLAEEEEVKSFKIIGWDSGTDVPVTIMVGTSISNPVIIPKIEIDKIDSLTAFITQGGTKITCETSKETIKSLLQVLAKWNYAPSTTALAAADYDIEFTPVVGTNTSTLKVKYTNSDGSVVTATPTGNLTVSKADYDIPSSVFADKKATYTGSAFNPEGWIDTSKLPEGMTVTYSCSTDLTAVGEHVVTATFSNPDPDNYNNPASKTAKLTITDKKLHDMSGVTVSGAGDGVTVEGDGESGFSASATYDPELTAGVTVGSLPTNVTVKDTVYEKKQADGTYVAVDGLPTDAGEYRVTVSFETDDPEYATPDDLVIDLTIAKADVDASGATFKPSATNGLTAGEDGVYKATYDPDGNGFEFTVNDLDPDSIPAGATPKAPVYKKLVNGTWETVTEIKEAGEYKVVVEFDPADPANYNDGIAPVEIAIKIDEAYITGVNAKLEEGATFTADNTLEDLKAKLTAEIEYNNGTKETLKPEDFEVTCNGLRDNGKFKAGIQSVTVKYGDFETIVNLTVNKVKVAVPTFKGGLTYTGASITPAVDKFDGYNADVMTYVTEKTLSGLNAGSYKAVFALNDIENYEWATTTANKKAVYKVTLYDEEIQLVAGETAVDWDIKKAILTASRTEGALPEFTSEGFVGALTDVVTLKYYTDETCQTEIAVEDLAKETEYYVRAELLDGNNFDLDASAMAFMAKPFSYTTPAGELTVGEKIVRFLKANWLWLVIAVVALILLITIIALCVRASKKKQRRLAEEKAERLAREEREREERRLEREERMARMNQQQAAPQPQYIPQPMPQMMPQMQMPMAQPMAQQGGMAMGGGVSEAQFMQMQAELATLKAAQESAKEVARAEHSAKELAQQQIAQAKLEMQVAGLMSHFGVEQSAPSSMSASWFEEIVDKAVEKALDKREKTSAQTAQQTESAPASTQVPPDAVMTTVTTTKIDTTKKPVQSTNDRASVGRPIVRNYVAPMPVDDGRVFDVGGFYKPADPVTDLGLTDDEDKKD